MVTQEKFFPTQEKEEKVFLLIRKHWFNYTIFFMLDLLVLISILTLIWYWVSNPDLLTTTLGAVLFLSISIFVLVIFAAQLYGFVDYYLDVYIVTDQRIVDISQDGFFKRQISELHLHQVQDVNATIEGFWGTLLHFGDVSIQTAGERENFIFRSIPRPYTVAKEIVNLHEEHLEQASKSDKQINFTADEEDSIRQDEALPYGKEHFSEANATSTLATVKTDERPRKTSIAKALPLKTKSANPKSADIPEISNKKTDQKSSASEEGELKEGREIDL